MAKNITSKQNSNSDIKINLKINKVVKPLITAVLTIMIALLFCTVAAKAENKGVQIIYTPSHDEIYRIKISDSGDMTIVGKHSSNSSVSISYRTIGFSFTTRSTGRDINSYRKQYGASSVFSYMYPEGSSYVTDKRKDGYLETTYFIPKEILKGALTELGVYDSKALSEGVTVYLSNIFTVTHKNNKTGSFEPSGSPLFTYADMTGAVNWTKETQNKLKHYYDMKITIRMEANEYIVIYEDSEGNVLQKLDPVTFVSDNKISVRVPAKINFASKEYSFTNRYYSSTDEKTEKIKNISLSDNSFLFKPVPGTKNYIHLIYRAESIPEKEDDSEKKPVVSGDANEYRITGQSDVSAGGVIAADNRGSEKFDVNNAVPGGESVYINVLTDEKQVFYEFTRVSGTKEYLVAAHKDYDLVWTDENGEKHEESERVTDYYYIPRYYSYYVLSNLEYYVADTALVSSEVLDEDIDVTAKGIDHSISVNVMDGEENHISHPVQTLWFDGGLIEGDGKRPEIYGTSYSEAERAFGSVRVRNDGLKVNGSTILNDSWTYDSGSAPLLSRLTKEKTCSGDAFYRKGIIIPERTENGFYSVSGTVTYKKIASVNGSRPENLTYILEINSPINIHTPVICNPLYSSDNKKYNQLVNPSEDVCELVLSENKDTSDILLTVANYGNHIEEKGYGKRDYSEYILANSVRFPFDVCVYSTDEVIPKDTWFDINGVLHVYAPVTTPEGIYDIEFRSAALNADSEVLTGTRDDSLLSAGASEKYANLDSKHTIAVGTVTVSVSGSFSELSIYSNSKQKKPGDIYALGQAVSLSLKTVGSFDTSYDYISLLPTFWLVDCETGERREADLYYVQVIQGKKKLIKVGGQEDRLNLWYMRPESISVPGALNEIKAYAAYAGISDSSWLTEKRPLFSFGLEKIGPYFRSFPNVLSGKNNRELTKVQRWFGEYFLPADLIIAEKGENIFEKAAFYGIDRLKESRRKKEPGKELLAVNFSIIARDISGGFDLDYLNEENSKRGYCSMWREDDIEKQVKLENGNYFTLYPGDLIIYDTSKLIQDEYTKSVTH